ncbi:TBC1 domain [Paramecium bursaria]
MGCHFYDYYQSNQDTLLLVDAIPSSMIVYVKNDLLKEEENSPCYQRFLKYVNITDLPGLIQQSFRVKDVILGLKTAEEVSEFQSQVIFILLVNIMISILILLVRFYKTPQPSSCCLSSYYPYCQVQRLNQQMDFHILLIFQFMFNYQRELRCQQEQLAYALCASDFQQQHQCQKEFQVLKQCLKK